MVSVEVIVRVVNGLDESLGAARVAVAAVTKDDPLEDEALSTRLPVGGGTSEESGDVLEVGTGDGEEETSKTVSVVV